MNKTFRVVARSSNTNSFGLRGHVLVSRDGAAYEVGRSDHSGNPTWAVGADVSIPCRLNTQGCIVGYDFPGCEIPRALPTPSKKVLKSIFVA